jgi:hypothetical protein
MRLLAILLFITSIASAQCLKAPTFLVSTPKGVSTVIGWQKNVCANGYSIRIRPVGIGFWRTIAVADTNRKEVFGLNYSTDYEYQIASKDSTTLSNYSTIRQFRTLCECLVPTIVIDSIGYNGLLFYIDDDTCGIKYVVKIKKQTDLYWNDVVKSDSTQTFVIDCLESNTGYVWRYKRICSNTGYSSLFGPTWYVKTL